MSALMLCACGGEPAAPEPLQPCVDAGAQAANPTTVEEAIDRLNSLPAPVTIPCLLASLRRPLEVVATRSFLSAQPSGGPGSPRMFIFFGDLEMSVVPAGLGVDLLEFGEFVSPRHTIKGELEMPLEEPVSYAAPFEHVIFEPGNPPTSCGFCHGEESEEKVLDGVPIFRSLAFRPHDDLLLSLDVVRIENEQCDWADDPVRCEMLHALFGFGEIHESAFSEELAQQGD